MMDAGFDPEFAAASDWARLYRANGVQIVPCKNKMPRLKSWKEYQNALVPDAQFEAWYGHDGEFAQSYDMGALTGTASGHLLMIDLDIYKAGGYAAAAWWQRVLAVHNNGMALETWEQLTGGGGLQMFFTYPPGWKFAVNAKTDINVDIRCQGGFAVLPPTMHASGKAYTWIDGRAPWEIPIALAPDWLLEEVEKLIREHGGGQANSTQMGANGTQTGAHDAYASHMRTDGAQFDDFGHQTDGRETKMRDLVWGAVVDWHRECPIKPSERESRDKASVKYDIYADQVSPRIIDPSRTKTELLEEEDRGPAEFWRKWSRAMELWDTKVAEEARKPGAKKDYKSYTDYTDEFAKAEEQAKAPGGAGLYEVLSVDDILGMADPTWLVDKLVVEQALGFIYGPPGCLKTFIALDMALSFTTGQPTWWNRSVQRQGTVVYISSEGQADLKFRLQAWEQHRKVKISGTPFRLIRQSINFMDPADVGKLLATVDAVAAETGPIAAVFVDTVSRVLPGAEENLQKDMSLFVAACDAVRQRFLATVFGLHHTSRNGNMRGSTVMPGAGDFIIEVRREPGAMSGSIYAFKIKAAEDGWEQPFAVTEVVLNGIVRHTSLMIDPVDEAPKNAPGRGWPDAAVCREILSAIDDQWKKGDPWCFATNSSRSGVTNIVKKWPIKRDIAKDILATWTAQGMIEEVEYNAKTHAKGYRKVFGF